MAMLAAQASVPLWDLSYDARAVGPGGSDSSVVRCRLLCAPSDRFFLELSLGLIRGPDGQRRRNRAQITHSGGPNHHDYSLRVPRGELSKSGHGRSVGHCEYWGSTDPSGKSCNLYHSVCSGKRVAKLRLSLKVNDAWRPQSGVRRPMLHLSFVDATCYHQHETATWTNFRVKARVRPDPPGALPGSQLWRRGFARGIADAFRRRDTTLSPGGFGGWDEVAGRGLVGSRLPGLVGGIVFSLPRRAGMT